MNIRDFRRLISSAPIGTKFVVTKESYLNLDIKESAPKPKSKELETEKK